MRLKKLSRAYEDHVVVIMIVAIPVFVAVIVVVVVVVAAAAVVVVAAAAVVVFVAVVVVVVAAVRAPIKVLTLGADEVIAVFAVAVSFQFVVVVTSCGPALFCLLLVPGSASIDFAFCTGLLVHEGSLKALGCFSAVRNSVVHVSAKDTPDRKLHFEASACLSLKLDVFGTLVAPFITFVLEFQRLPAMWGPLHMV